ncbi:MAG TPA: dipicolinate synthase subunit DpsA [Caproicibacter sp.]|nr:dipicolinate synthase subunit DpsA [Caproicibacter sp.]
MTSGVTFGVLGGDRRQISLAESLVLNGYEVYTCGFEKEDFNADVKKAVLDELIKKCRIIILPLPVTLDGINLKMDYCDEKIKLDDAFAEKMRGKRVFGGMMERLYRTSEIWKEIDTADYYTREEFAIRNAVPTAEGAIEIAMREYPGTISGSRCLVAGFGRVGKILAWMLRGIGAKVTVSARRPADLAWIESYGYDSVLTARIGFEERYDLIFNTIPSMIFNRRVLSELRGCSLLLDLASAPGGVDFEAAEKIGIRAILAPSLPGRVAPKTAGEIIRDTVCHMMGE